RLEENRPANNTEEKNEILRESPKPSAPDQRRKSSLFGRIRKSMWRNNSEPAQRLEENRPANNTEEKNEILRESPKPSAPDQRRKSSLFGRIRKSMWRNNSEPAQ
ncbi:unnamed protein product, partial [Darwinula stevensoni]